MISQVQPTILVIEDDAAIRQTLVDMLELNGYTPLSAANGLDGLALARRDLPSLVITDISLPGLTGYELLEHFRADERLRTTPVIVVSAKVDRAATRHGMELGAADFITKPFTENEVLQSIRTRLEKKELMDELDAFAHTVAHDLKNPLATLFGRLGLLAMQVEPLGDATLSHHAAEANLAASRLSSIIDDLLLLAGVRQQRIILEPIDTGAIVGEAVDRLEDLLRRSGAQVSRPPTWPAAIGYAPWITNVWCNYISNAAKYAGERPQIELGAEQQPGGNYTRFWVQDHGPGLDPTAQAALFVPFTRISAIRVKGHGLGLSIVRRIVEKLGGQVGVVSQPGHGARFWFELPSSPQPIAPSP